MQLTFARVCVWLLPSSACLPVGHPAQDTCTSVRLPDSPVARGPGRLSGGSVQEGGELGQRQGLVWISVGGQGHPTSLLDSGAGWALPTFLPSHSDNSRVQARHL